eukprot:gene2244-2959_t
MAPTTVATQFGRVDEKFDLQSGRPRLLALHGWRSNALITEKQIANLGLHKTFDVTYINGYLESHIAANTVVESMFSGPYFSWVDQIDWTEDNGLHDISERQAPIIMASLQFLVSEIQRLGPFDAIFGFSQGACVAALLCHPSVLLALGEDERLFDRAIFACAGHFNMLRCIKGAVLGAIEDAGLEPLEHESMLTVGRECAIHIPTLHLIGVEDELKVEGERWVQMFRPEDRVNLYLKGGHQISIGSEADLRADISDFMQSATSWMKHPLPRVRKAAASRSHSKLQTENKLFAWIDSCFADSPNLADTPKLPEVIPTGLHTSAGGLELTLSHTLQAINSAEAVAHSEASTLYFNPEMLSLVEVRNSGPNMGITIQEALSRWPASAPAMLDHDPAKPPLTYGALLEFIRGPGNLSRFGVRSSEAVVGYPCPPGAAGAVALLGIAAQCTAAPLNAAATETDVLDAIQQFCITHLLAFDGVEAPGFIAAAARAGLDVAVAHLDTMAAGTWLPPKLQGPDVVDAGQLINPISGTGLYLRTSGTTSRTKVVPLQVGPLMQNGFSLGVSLGIGPSDVCLNIMPLFHIGGIAGSIMAVIATGGSTLFAPPFKPEEFIDMLAHSATPTWYSSVPTMHMAAFNHASQLYNGRPPPNHLRFIRSGAAALAHEDAVRLRDFWGVPIIPTYSMSELMPISQPKEGYKLEHPDAVGQPVIASIALVDRETLRPVPFGVPGEVCIAGPTVMSGYHENAEANAKAFFILGEKTYMRTGDVGLLNTEGYLTLVGRTKELIKRGGEQVSPFEVEAVLDQHPLVKKSVCFAVPDQLWGETVGCALVLWDSAALSATAAEKELLLTEVRKYARQAGLELHKIPAHFRIVDEDDLPMTATKKYIRIGLAQVLGVTGSTVAAVSHPLSYSSCFAGLRFVLSCAVVFNHYGTTEIDPEEAGHGDPTTNGLGVLSNMRSDWPFSVFFILGGFSLAASTTKTVDNYGGFYKAKLASMQPTYLLVMLLCTVNLLVVCHPDVYDTNFTGFRHEQHVTSSEKGCAATWVQMPWGLTLLTTILIYILQMQSWFFALPFMWFLMFYAWFSSVYYFLLASFPIFWNFIFPKRDNERSLWICMAICLLLFWLRSILLGIPLYLLSVSEDDDDFDFANAWGISAYLFPPSFLPYFDKSTESLNIRLWSAFLTSLYVPLTLPWIYFLAVGEGYTAKMLSGDLLVNRLSPAAYHIYLVHQPVGQFYWWLTRDAGDWAWWDDRKNYYWFSPHALPVPWFEYGFLIALNVAVASFLATYVDVWGTRVWMRAWAFVFGDIVADDHDPGQLVLRAIEHITGAKVEQDLTLFEAGLASVGIPVLVAALNESNPKLDLTVQDLAECATVNDIVDLFAKWFIKAGNAANKKTKYPQVIRN